MNPTSLGRYIPGPWIQAFLLQDRFFDGQYDEMIDAMRSTAFEKSYQKGWISYGHP